MEQRDFLQKQIDQLGRALGKVMADLLGLKSKGEISQGTEITSQQLKEELDLDIEEMINLPAEELISILKQKKDISNEGLEKLADILLVIADDFHTREAEKERSLKLYQKCLMIYIRLEAEESTYLFDRHLKTERLKVLTGLAADKDHKL